MEHLIALSGGKDSTAMALRLASLEPRDYQYIFTPTGDELPEMVEHWKILEERLNSPLITASSRYTLSELVTKMNCLPNFRMRFCTKMLKIIPFQAYIINHKPCTIYVGLRADEEGRVGVEWDDPQITVRYPLREWNWGLTEVINYLSCQNINIPRRTDCARCFYQTLYEWYLLWKEHPDIYESVVQEEEKIGYTYRSPSRDTQPARLLELREKFQAGYIPKERTRTMSCRVCSK